MRVSPVSHSVRAHSREAGAVKVVSYRRGKGKQKETSRLTGKRFSNNDDKSHGGFGVFIKYAESGGINTVVKSTNYKDALRKSIGYADHQIKSITLRKMEPQSVEVK